MRSFTLPALLFYLYGAALATGAPRTVKDFLLLLPEKYLGFENVKIPASERLDMIEVDDTANGWLKLTGKGGRAFEGWIELALFRGGSGGPLLGIAVNHCGPLCEQQLFFLRYARGDWQDLTATVFQPLAADRVSELYHAAFPGDEFADDPPVLYRLPRKGTDLLLVTQEALAGREAILARYRLQDGRFIL